MVFNTSISSSGPVKIYGVSWDGSSSTAMTRIGASAGFADPEPYIAGATSYGSPFDDLYPWNGMMRVTDPVAGELVSIPKFYYKLTQNSNGVIVQIADDKVDGFSVSPAHMDRNDGGGERDVIYIGRYHCINSYKSISGFAATYNMTRETARTEIAALGNGISQMDFATRFTIWLLYIVEFADWNSRAKIGFGSADDTMFENNGASDSMPYHTGTIKSSRNAIGQGIQYRYIEDLWAGYYDWMDGCYYSSDGMNIILNPANFSDSENGICIGTPSGGYPTALSIKDVSGAFPCFTPSTSGGSSTTYIPDFWGFASNYPCLYVGGDFNCSQGCGIFTIFSGMSGFQNIGIGCRLQKLP